ncbi:hypothetical protein PTKIN_Ptkin04bG0119300 [Pterospermum kingtungense]
MAMKNSFVHLFSTILWLSLLLLFFGWCNLFSKDINRINISRQVSISHHTFSNRKVLATKFDFTPFLHHQKHHPRHHPVDFHDVHSGPSGNEIDPRYGVEKRLVPTGPNPLHH